MVAFMVELFKQLRHHRARHARQPHPGAGRTTISIARHHRLELRPQIPHGPRSLSGQAAHLQRKRLGLRHPRRYKLRPAEARPTTATTDRSRPPTSDRGAVVGHPRVEFDRWNATASVAGEFVWTGFDYLGEPTPFNGSRPRNATASGPQQLLRHRRPCRHCRRTATTSTAATGGRRKHRHISAALELAGPRGQAGAGHRLHQRRRGRALPQRPQPWPRKKSRSTPGFR